MLKSFSCLSILKGGLENLCYVLKSFFILSMHCGTVGFMLKKFSVKKHTFVKGERKVQKNILKNKGNLG